MSKASEIIVLCEDKAHEVFCHRFLTKGWGVKTRSIRTLDYPSSGKGSGKKYVEDNIARQAKRIRSRHASKVLIVIRDADEDTVDQVKSILDEKIKPARSENEAIVFIVPKWHIQTWIAYLDDKKVDESDKTTYKNEYREISECKKAHPYIDSLAKKCKENESLFLPPDSLKKACEEFERIRNILK